MKTLDGNQIGSVQAILAQFDLKRYVVIVTLDHAGKMIP